MLIKTKKIMNKLLRSIYVKFFKKNIWNFMSNDGLDYTLVTRTINKISL